MGTPFDYDRELYDRRFMSCLFRHVVVQFKRFGVPADLLFYDALASSDFVLQQIVVERQPKFAFLCDAFTAGDFALVGATEIQTPADSFDTIRPLIVERLARGEVAFLEGNVFHLPHCPEYLNAHAQHVIVIDRITDDGRWHIVDDDPASVLFEYDYDEAYIAAFFENSVNRNLRCYDLDRSLSVDTIRERVAQRFCAFVGTRRDSFAFYDAIEPVVTFAYESGPARYRTLHDAFVLLSGSRACFAHYLQVGGWGDTIVAQAHACSAAATALKNVMARAKITGTLGFDKLAQRCTQLKDLEAELCHMLGRLVR